MMKQNENNVQFSDIVLIISNIKNNIITRIPCHKYMLSNSSYLFKDIISVISDEEKEFNLYVNDDEESSDIVHIINFIYGTHDYVPLDCIKTIIKSQFNTAASWILKNKLHDVKPEDVEDLYILVTKKNLWELDTNNYRQPVLEHLFNIWTNFNGTKCYNGFVMNIDSFSLLALIKSYKQHNKCHDIISILVIKYIFYNRDNIEVLKRSEKIVEEIDFKFLSKSLRRNWLNNLNLMGYNIMKKENDKIIELLLTKNTHSYSFDSNDMMVKRIFDADDIDNIYVSIPIENTFYNLEIKYTDNKFSAKLNDLNRYSLEGVEVDVIADININIIANNYPHWVHITGNFKSLPVVEDTLYHHYPREQFNNVNEDDIMYHDTTIIKIITTVFLKN